MIKTKEFTLSVMLAVLTFLLPSTPGGEAALDWAQNGLNSVFLAYDYGAMDCDIISPSINDQFSAGESIYFNTSLTEGTYPFDSSTAYWTSDEEGTFLSATSGYASLTTPGYHGLTFYIQTTAGHYCSHGFDIEIIGGGATPPSCGVSFPSSGTSYSAGEQFTLGGNWYMGSYDVTDYWWTSSLEGTILSNSSFGGVTLSQNGTHTITFYVQDSQGQTCSDTIDVSISGGVENVEEDPNYDYYCYGDDVWWQNQAGQWTELKESCTYGCTGWSCDDAPDDEVDPYYDYFCNEGDVWWQNQFGEWTEIREYCSYGCTTSWTCDSSDEDPYYDYFCNGDDVWWQNVSGEWTELKESCTYGCTDWWCDDSDDVEEDPYYDYFCYGDDVWWQNRSGEWTELKESCTYGCTDWWCDDSDEDVEDPYYDYFCYGDDVWWQNQDGEWTELRESCTYGCTDWWCDDSDEDDDGYCAPGCPDYYINDGWCDADCDNEACNYDGIDCDEDDGDDDEENEDADIDADGDGWCGNYCPVYWAGDDYCQGECNVAECDYDRGDCDGYCDAFCEHDWIGDGTCDDSCNNYFCEYDGGDCGSDDEDFGDDSDDADNYYDYRCYEDYGAIYWEDQDGNQTDLKEECEYSCSEGTKICYDEGFAVTAIYPAQGDSSEVMEDATFHRYYLVTLHHEAEPNVDVTVVDPDGDEEVFYANSEGLLDIEFDASSLGAHAYHNYEITNIGGIDLEDPVEFDAYIFDSNHRKAFSGSFSKQIEASVVVQAEGAEETKRTVVYYPEYYQTKVDLNTKYQGGVGISCGESGIQVEAGSAKALVGYECGISGGLFTDEVLGYEFNYNEYSNSTSYGSGERADALQLFNMLTMSYAHQISPLLRQVVQESAAMLSGSIDDYLYKQGLAIGGYGKAEIDAGIGVAVGGDMTNVGAFAGAGVSGEMSIGAMEYLNDNKESFTLRGALQTDASLSAGVALDEDTKLGVSGELWKLTGEGSLERFYSSSGQVIETVLTIATDDSTYEYKFNGSSGYDDLWEDLESQGGLSFNNILYYFMSYAAGDPYAIIEYTEYAHVDQDKEDFALGASGKLVGVGGELGIKLNEDTKLIYVKEKRVLIGGQEFIIEEYDRPSEVSLTMEDLIINSFAVANPEFMEALTETGEAIEAAAVTLEDGVQTVQDGVMDFGSAALNFFGL